MLIVASDAGEGGIRRGHRDGRHVTADAGESVVNLVRKLHGPAPALVLRYLHGDLERDRRLQLALLVAGSAIGLLGTLVMTDLAPARRLEGQFLVRAEFVTGETGEFAMAVVGEGVAGRDETFGPTPGRIVFRGRRPLAP